MQSEYIIFIYACNIHIHVVDVDDVYRCALCAVFSATFIIRVRRCAHSNWSAPTSLNTSRRFVGILIIYFTKFAYPDICMTFPCIVLSHLSTQMPRPRRRHRESRSRSRSSANYRDKRRRVDIEESSRKSSVTRYVDILDGCTKQHKPDAIAICLFCAAIGPKLLTPDFTHE